MRDFLLLPPRAVALLAVLSVIVFMFGLVVLFAVVALPFVLGYAVLVTAAKHLRIDTRKKSG